MMLPTGTAGWNRHQGASEVSVPADIHAGDAVAVERHSKVHDALSVRNYSNVVVVFRDGKAIAIFNFPGGQWGRHQAPKGLIEYLKRQDAAAGAAGDKKDAQKLKKGTEKD